MVWVRQSAAPSTAARKTPMRVMSPGAGWSLKQTCLPMRPCCWTASLSTSRREFTFWVIWCPGHAARPSRDSAVTTGSGIVRQRRKSLTEPLPAATAGISNIPCPAANSPRAAARNCAKTPFRFYRRNWRSRWKRRKPHPSRGYSTMRRNRWCRGVSRWSEMPPLLFVLTPQWAFPRPRATRWRCAMPCGKRRICPAPFRDIREPACRWANQLPPMDGALPKPRCKHGSKIGNAAALRHSTFALRLRREFSMEGLRHVQYLRDRERETKHAVATPAVQGRRGGSDGNGGGQPGGPGAGAITPAGHRSHP
ncbi:hypothetical protein AGR6A_Lc190205 [Agrobacterium sp. NCPPB 925]|nr:hypothetical protein AGR6A_Lc190205 [Agrobacterium sp. NCPPB 925]